MDLKREQTRIEKLIKRLLQSQREMMMAWTKAVTSMKGREKIEVSTKQGDRLNVVDKEMFNVTLRCLPWVTNF